MGMNTITKKEIVERIAAKTGLTKVAAKEAVQLFLDTVIEELERGNRIELRDFGVYEIKERAKRVGRNPRTGEPVPVPNRPVVNFKVGRQMKQRVAEAWAVRKAAAEAPAQTTSDLQTESPSSNPTGQGSVSNWTTGGSQDRPPFS